MANILIVDDLAEVRNHIRIVAENNGHTIFEAKNGLECIKIIKENNIDLLILDILMPEKGGIETLVELKNYKDLRKILITGMHVNAPEIINDLGSRLGACSILFKPFRKNELIKAINDAICKTV